MKVVNVFAQIFAILAFLTLGSLLIIVAIHILSVDDAVLRIREVYASPWRSFQAGVVGLLFIAVGLAFSKMLVKQGRESETLIFQSDIGPIVVSVTAIEDVIKKVLKHFHIVKDWKVKTLFQGKEVKIKLRLILWSGAQLPELLNEIQSEIRTRVRKMLSQENLVEVACEIQRIEDHGLESHEMLDEHPKTVIR